MTRRIWRTDSLQTMQRVQDERGLIFVCTAALATVLLAVLPLAAQEAGAGKQTPPAPAKNAAQADAPDRGQRVFEQNCSRCHASPEGFSPRVSGTIARHMRVRANLNDADYKDLVHFLNP